MHKYHAGFMLVAYYCSDMHITCMLFVCMLAACYYSEATCMLHAYHIYVLVSCMLLGLGGTKMIVYNSVYPKYTSAAYNRL